MMSIYEEGTLLFCKSSQEGCMLLKVVSEEEYCKSVSYLHEHKMFPITVKMIWTKNSDWDIGEYNAYPPYYPAKFRWTRVDEEEAAMLILKEENNE